jgi:hypothetical protein
MIEILDNILRNIVGKDQDSNAISKKALTPLCEATRTELAKEIYMCVPRKLLWYRDSYATQPTQALKLFTRQKSY